MSNEQTNTGDSSSSSSRHRSSSRHHHHHSSGHHHSRHHSHHYDGPRSSMAEGLSEDYDITLTDEITKSNPEEEMINLVFDQDDLDKTIGETTRSSSSSDQNHKDHKNHNHKKSKKKRKHHRDAWGRSRRKSKVLVTILGVIAAILLLIIAAFLLLRYIGEKNLEKSVVEAPVEVELPEEAEPVDETNLVIYNGERYWYNEDIITVLCIGVDREEFVSNDEMVIGGNGQADADVLMIIDKKTGKINLLNISRDCNVDIDRYNDMGQYIDTKKEQLCLSFAFGDGGQTSCENTALSVSRLLYGMPVNAYVAIDFESIAILNDAVGGVTVPITEEVAQEFPGYEVGSNIELVGTQAVTYVRERDTSVLDSNNPRMSRQKKYLLAFIKKAIAQLKEDPTKAVSLYNAVTDNMVTSIKLSEVTYFGTLFAKSGFKEENLYSVKGEVIEAEDGYALFMPDEKALYETVLELFYIKE